MSPVAMKVEYSQLNSKIGAMKAYVANIKGDIVSVPDGELELAQKQLKAMENYRNLLEERCALLHVQL